MKLSINQSFYPKNEPTRILFQNYQHRIAHFLWAVVPTRDVVPQEGQGIDQLPLPGALANDEDVQNGECIRCDTILRKQRDDGISQNHCMHIYDSMTMSCFKMVHLFLVAVSSLM